ncbi:MAG: type 1 glutamine amidotransferase [Alphaproteobacteria bacterium]|nr:type 1 glutamine amidotransferase [Alphaproteobacteria bacterium]
MRFLVFQHIAVEHPGIFRRFLAEDGIAWDVVELDAGEPIPALDGYDALWVMGGPMDVWEEADYPWLPAEKAAIREAVEDRAMPFLGFCLGHQLLAVALGGSVGQMAEPEVGFMQVTAQAAARQDPLFDGAEPALICFQWHGAEVTELPPGAQILASSPGCPVQAFRAAPRAWGFQYHVEITAETIPEWGAVPAYAASLAEVMGAGALSRLAAEAEAALPALEQTARRLYDNFKGCL